MTKRPTIIHQPSLAAVEAAKAKFWRKSVRRLTCKELARATGYSVSSIGMFERGYGNDGKPLGPRAWARYRLVCAGLDNPEFRWGMS
jgi:hypothetical protein